MPDLADHPIPPMTDPLGQHWDQPDRSEIEIDPTFAIMSQAACDKLADYSCSQPSGVYPGKMWKCRHVYSDKCRSFDLCWYGPISEDGKSVSNHRRTIIIS